MISSSTSMALRCNGLCYFRGELQATMCSRPPGHYTDFLWGIDNFQNTGQSTLTFSFWKWKGWLRCLQGLVVSTMRTWNMPPASHWPSRASRRVVDYVMLYRHWNFCGSLLEFYTDFFWRNCYFKWNIIHIEYSLNFGKSCDLVLLFLFFWYLQKKSSYLTVLSGRSLWIFL